VDGLTKISRQWLIVLAFFEGAAVSLISYDLSDYFNYYAQRGGGPLSPFYQVFYYAVLPTLLYLGLAGASYVLARTGRLKPEYFLWLFLAFFVSIPAVAGLLLPQASSAYYVGAIVLGTIASFAIVIGLMREVNGIKPKR
jgi:hypothetical protein